MATSFALVGLIFLASAARAEEPELVFESHVRSILQAHCTRCHGENTRKAELNLLSPASLRVGGESGETLLTDDPVESPLLIAIVEGAMPPDDGSRPSAAEVATIRAWLEGGAKFADRPAATDEGALPTDQDLIPVLLRRCAMCHGGTVREADLDLRSAESMLRGGSGGPALKVGAPDASAMLQRVRSAACPPKGALGQAGIEPMTSEEQQLLAAWIQQGARVEPVPEDEVALGQDPLVTVQDREHWSFRRPVKVAPPQVGHQELVSNPIDAFLLAELESRGLTFNHEARKRTLLRRAAFDLTGLPPRPSDIQSFLEDDSEQAYERMIDRFLASPRYGERWGRFWLDIAGYADSEGKRHADMIRPYAWRYRDYVIRSFNENRPYDQFLLEQLAGDELVDYQREVTDEVIEKLVATGFLRMAPDGTSANPVNRFSDRIEVIADELDVVGRGLLGLTLNCARCHSHKYDPLPQRDYYRMMAVFKGAYDEYDWLTPQPFGNQWSKAERRHLTVLTAAEQQELAAHNEPIERQVQALNKEIKQLKQKPSTSETANDEAKSGEKAEPAEEPADKKARDKRIKEVEAEIKKLKVQLREAPKIRALWDRGRPSPTFVYRRGDETQPARQVHPGVPSVLTSASLPYEVRPVDHESPKTGRRLAFARWLTDPDHPLTARVFVNRVWQRHFGRGLVVSLDNFGKLGTPPTHPELLDWLAVEFVESGWNIKHLHRLMMTSRAYRQSSKLESSHLQQDPHNEWLSRMPMRRLDAEAVRDSILWAAGRLTERPFGKPDDVDVRGDGLVTSKPMDGGWRRSIYVRQRRKEMPTLLETFDLPQMNPNCTRRPSSTVVSQPLALLNNGMIHTLSQDFAKRVAEQAGSDSTNRVNAAFAWAIGRPPFDEERQVALETLETLTNEWSAIETEASASAEDRALADFCHLLINSAAFLYID